MVLATVLAAPSAFEGPRCLRAAAAAKLLGAPRLALNAPVRADEVLWPALKAARLSHIPIVGSCPKLQVADASDDAPWMLGERVLESLCHVAVSSLTRCSASASSSVSTRPHSSRTPIGLDGASPTAISRSLIRTGSALLYLNELRGVRHSGFSHGSYCAMDAPGRPQIGAPNPDEARTGENEPALRTDAAEWADCLDDGRDIPTMMSPRLSHPSAAASQPPAPSRHPARPHQYGHAQAAQASGEPALDGGLSSALPTTCCAAPHGPAQPADPCNNTLGLVPRRTSRHHPAEVALRSGIVIIIIISGSSYSRHRLERFSSAGVFSFALIP